MMRILILAAAILLAAALPSQAGGPVEPIFDTNSTDTNGVRATYTTYLPFVALDPVE